MSGIFIALPVAVMIAVAAVAAFIWAARRDQFEDLDTPPRRMLHDDVPLPSQQTEKRTLH
ncbi:MAG: cbb3-type cytochrome oxidase assembly protein CcoS [Phycisphaerae bacterium]|nr:cbb3-type cytochrome oxidase assembly protein CcoS [Phycisphaerae bacterium]